MLVTYPAIFYYNKEEGYYIYFPDLKSSGTQGSNISEAVDMASDYLGIMISSIIESGDIVPKASKITDISVIEDYPFKDENDLKDYYDIEESFISLVYVDLTEYFESNKLVKKTLNIPKWANDLGIKLNVNFSNLLTDSISKLAINRND
ncbi:MULTISPECIES: type II toxin-antitoxin system HicB family antitoxin [unclassified Gemella]|uniref:type II toxin-antitoxin system HicB family antitoxin n=1 Tax=unclassified Gemella TaxID=2624949 RepID=UPI0010749252|nr:MULTISPECIES: type II toxin-antitoxin system HicB family antitoxin [unclassified Gemella]MBF0710174.1 type II toxin-antitoxin system HicB family antitoxin [Gemella sp. GL1.1]MBF0746475.1 type II toxin-antitoxin system HicB family antitoxin [Gemella sp. 19428wG2_WT2a]NYS27518.1 type II toxin-antitoxin system HicB family antitoxin [Gemella sp. GL1]TFU60255.1 type II toxin-antitoxin system HicB family antitoxin [Gemella sp. WT2a]